MTSLKEHQPSFSIDEQIKNLIEKGLIIRNETYAKSILNQISYFRLIKGYSLGLKTKNDKYIEGTKFEDIVGLHSFNTSLRQALLTQIEKVEIRLRCRLANYFCDTYGVLGYENANNFQNPVFHAKLMTDIETEMERNNKIPFVKNFRQNYRDGKLPFYALIELLSFGNLSKLFKNMKNADKKAVSSTFNIGYTYFESWIESLVQVRNMCAHYGRVYNCKLVTTPQLYKQYVEKGIDNHRIFASILTLRHILPLDRHWDDFADSIVLLLEKHPSVKLELLGFPEDWKDYL